MSSQPIVQYIRFEALALARVYFFSVRDTSSEACEYTLTIPNEAFNSHRARYQDAAAICSLRLHRELDAPAHQHAAAQYAITDAELDDYRSSHSPKPVRGLYPRKEPVRNV